MEPIIKEKRSYLGLLLSILAFIIITIISFFLYQYVTQPVPLATLTTLESYGLSEPLDPEATPFGTILFTKYTEATAETDSLPYIYQYNFETDTEDLLSSQSFTEAVALSATTTLVIKDNTIALYDRTTETLTTLPHQPNSVLSDLTISPDQTRYAYSYREPDIADPDNLGAYSIAIHTFGSEGVEVVGEGGKGAWIKEGDAIVYLGKKGIHQYSFEAKESITLSTIYTPYTASDDVAVAPDSQTVIFTKANQNLLSVLTFENTKAISSTLVEKGRIVTEHTSYSKPVFSQDSTMYVILALEVQNLKKDTDDKHSFVLVQTIEIRQIGNSKIIKTNLLGKNIKERYLINAWSVN